MITGIITGILAGFLACKIMHTEGKGCIMNLLLGLIGGFVGGLLAEALGITTVSWVGDLIVSIVGAVVVLWGWAKLK